MRKIPFRSAPKRSSNGTDIERIEVFSHGAGYVTRLLLPAGNIKRHNKPLSERIDEWLARYEKTALNASLDELMTLWQDCPSADLPARAELQKRIEAMRRDMQSSASAPSAPDEPAPIKGPATGG